MGKETYLMKAHCKNCGHSWTVEIERGKEAPQHFPSEECPYCGCESGVIDGQPTRSKGINLADKMA